MASEVTGWRALVPRLPSLALIALGVAALYEASSLTLGTARQPDSGFYPTLICVLIIVFGILALADPPPPRREQAAGGARAHGRVWLVVVALVAYALALTPVGFVLCTAALLVLLLRGIGGISWVGSLVSAVVGSVACYGAFIKLGLPLPAGVLGL